MTTDGRNLRQIVATTDVHSAFDNAAPFLTHLHSLRPTSLIVDCGDFFEGSGYYRLARGTIERGILLRLYDVLAPATTAGPTTSNPTFTGALSAPMPWMPTPATLCSAACTSPTSMDGASA